MLIVHATNVHQGGGRSLLLPLLEALEPPAIVTLDSRLNTLPTLASGVTVRTCQPSLLGRLVAEWNLRQAAGADDVILCFGNLPPLFRTSARTVVFLQNRYLLGSEGLASLPWRARLRVQVERAWLRLCLRDADLVVQTPAMARATEDALGRTPNVCAFAAPSIAQGPVPAGSGKQDIDYLYVASAEPHKNHRNLLLAWAILAAEGNAPSLGLATAAELPDDLQQHVSALRTQGASILMVEPRAANEMSTLYARAGALIYPSLMESFGLPLLEARAAGLPILAAERDYVRDVIVPQETFDPLSPVSIARAVRRFQRQEEQLVEVSDPARFLACLDLQG